MAQLIFEWKPRASYAAEDFLLSDSNQQAVQLVDHWPVSAPALLLYGPQASGKTHLAHRWATDSKAVFLDAKLLGQTPSEALFHETGNGVLEDIDAIKDEQALFHLLRHVESHGKRLLLTARVSAKDLALQLPDLRSRLLALPQARIHLPDEALLQGYILKCFADHQLRIGDDVMAYILRRTERSFAAAQGTVEQIVRLSSESKRAITIPLVKILLP